MNAIVPAQPSSPAEIMETVLIKGDLSKLTVAERNSYYFKLCESVGLNPLTQPIEYINLNGKLRLYAKKDCTDQLRAIHNVSVTEMTETERDGVFIVTCKVVNGTGRTDIAKGAVNIKGLTGEPLANALMKTETKAKRRATLSICGLGILDETEVDDIPANQKGTVERPRVPSPSEVEIVPTKPHFISPTGKGVAWGAEYIAAFQTATTMAELIEWDKLHDTILGEVQAKAPKLYEKISHAYAAKQKELAPTGEQKPDPITSGPQPNVDKSAHTVGAKKSTSPNIETEYDAWFSYILDKIAHAEDGGWLETFFNDEVEAKRSTIFPSDFADLQDAFTKAQNRLNAED